MGDPKLVAAVLDDWRTAPVSGKTTAILGFLERVTLSPSEVSPGDIAPLRAAGLDRQAIQEALYVCFLFNVMDRLADSFDFPLPPAQGVGRNGRILYTFGYNLLSIPG